MTTIDLIYEFARERLPVLVRDIVRKEMRDLLNKVECDRATWRCTWCDYVNVRFNAGMDHCSACGAETMTYFVAAGDLRVRYSRNPKCQRNRAHARSRARRSPHLDCVATTGCKASVLNHP
jgi:hypothetical protein